MAQGAVCLEPVRGAEVQLLDQVGIGPSELTEQELPEQRVVAVPLPVPVERHQEGVRLLEGPEPLVGTRFLQDRVAQRSVEPVEHGGAPEEPLHRRVELAQRLLVEVVRDVAVVA